MWNDDNTGVLESFLAVLHTVKLSDEASWRIEATILTSDKIESKENDLDTKFVKHMEKKD